MSELVAKFCSENEELKALSNGLPEDELVNLHWALITVIYSNRYKKQDEFWDEMSIDFTHIW